MKKILFILLAVLLLSFVYRNAPDGAAASMVSNYPDTVHLGLGYLHALPEYLLEVLIALLPIVGILNYLIFFWDGLMEMLGRSKRRVSHKVNPQTINFKKAAKEVKIAEAEGEAEAIIKVQAATAEGIKLINESDPAEAVLTIKSLEAFAKAADGQATKIIIPSNIQGIAGLANALTESVVSPK